MRELESLCLGDDSAVDWAQARSLAEAGTIAGNIFPGDIPGSDGYGRIFYSLS